MAAVQLAQETYLPGEGAEMAKVYDFFAAHEAAHGEPPAPQYFLSGPGPGDQVALPAEVYEILRKVVGAMRAGLAVSIAPQSQKLCLLYTSDAADDLLCVDLGGR